MTFVPVPGVGAGHFEPGQNLANWVDKEYLPLRKWNGDYDPEGLLSTLPAIANCLLGVFAGELLKSNRERPPQGALPDAARRRLCHCWAGCGTPSFRSSRRSGRRRSCWSRSATVPCLLGLFYLMMDVWKYRSWAQPFVWIGMNPITIYMIHNLVDIGAIANRFVGGDLKKLYLGRVW